MDIGELANTMIEEELKCIVMSDTPIVPEAWIILYKGTQIRMSSGKSVWAKKHYAMAALNLQFSTLRMQLGMEGAKEGHTFLYGETICNAILRDMIDRGIIEIKRVS